MLKKLVAVGAALVALTLAVTIAWADTNWPNEPPGSLVLVDDNFSLYDGVAWTCDNSGKGGIVQDATAPLSGPNVLRYQYRVGDFVAGSSPDSCVFTFPAKNEIYVGFWHKTSPVFEVGAGSATKIVFITSPRIQSEFIPTLSNHLGPMGGVDGFPLAVYFPNGQNINNCQINQQKFGDCPGTINIFPKQWCELNGCAPLAQIKRDTWYRHEVYIKKSTTRTSQDGIIKYWITEKNGARTLIADVNNMNWVEEGIGFVAINSTWGGMYGTSYGSSQGGSPVDGAYYWDHMRISVPNCPPSGCATPEPEPQPTEQCRDGIDNDADGKIDYPADLGCSNALDNNEADDPVVNPDGAIVPSPTSLTSTVVKETSKQVSISITKTGSNQNTWRPQSNTPWISTNPPLGGSSTITTETDTLTVTMNATGKVVGQYTGSITILETGPGISNNLTIPVTMNVVEAGPQFDNKSATRCSGSCTDVELNHTIGSGSDRALYVTVNWFSLGSTTIDPVKFDGVDAEYVDGIVNTNCPYFCGSQLWRVLAPHEGTHPITVHSSSGVNMIVSGMSFFGVNQTTPEGAPQTGTGQSATPSLSFSSGTDEMVVGTLSIANAGGSLSGGPGMTLSSNQYDSGGFIQSLSGYMQGDTSVDFKGVYSTSQKYSMVAVPIKPAAVVSPPDPVDPPPSSPVITSATGGVVDFTHDGIDLAGFNVYYSAGPGQTKTNLGLALNPTIRTLTYSQGCFQMSAYDAGGNESALSAEVCSVAPTVNAPTSLLTTSLSSLRVVDGKGQAWELRGTTQPYMLYMDGECGKCDVVGYSLRFNTELKTVEVEFLPGRFIRRDLTINDWVILKWPDNTPGQTVAALVTGAFLHDGVNVSGFNVYRSTDTGQSKTKLDIVVGPSARSFKDNKNTFGCYELAAYDGTGKEGPRSNESCTSSSPTGPLDVGLINNLKVIDFNGRTWELQGASAPYVLYRDGVCECSIVGYSLRYRTGVVEVEDLPGHWIRRDEQLQDWVVVAP